MEDMNVCEYSPNKPVTIGSIKRIVATHGDTCSVCGKRANVIIDIKEKTSNRPVYHLGYKCNSGLFLFNKDHIIPRSFGTNAAIENIRLTCQPCNSNKRDLYIPGDFARIIKEFIKNNDKFIFKKLVSSTNRDLFIFKIMMYGNKDDIKALCNTAPNDPKLRKIREVFLNDKPDETFVVCG